MIKVTAIGNLGKDAIINTVNGKNVINFSIASTEKWKDNSGQAKEKTTWLECGYWIESTGVAQYLKKGTQVYVEGNADVRQWNTADGKSGASLTCKVFSLQLLGSPNSNNAGNNSDAGQATQADQFVEHQTGGAVANGTTAPPAKKLPF